MHWSYAIKGIIVYNLYIAGSPIYEWDYYNNVFRVGNVDRNANRTAALNLPQPSTTAASTTALS